MIYIVLKPQHDGTMVQLGWNAGPRHAKVWGLAKSYLDTTDQETMINHDEDAVALLTVCWSLAKAAMPLEITNHIEGCLESSGLPRVATRNLPEGKLSCINI
jgi:hypothetical protein